MLEGEARELQLPVRAPAHQQRAGVMLQLRRDRSKGGRAWRGMVQAHAEGCEALSMDRSLGKMEHGCTVLSDGSHFLCDSLSPHMLAPLRDPRSPPAKQSVDVVTLLQPGCSYGQS